MTPDQEDIVPAKPYPKKSARYNAYGWNQQYQTCYLPEEIELLNDIQSQYKTLSDPAAIDYFTLKTDYKFFQQWQCVTPTYMLGAKDFTLPYQARRDSQHYPLWRYSDKMARSIANWQSDRIRDQVPALLNDPTMLVLEELKYWYFNNLAVKECRLDERDVLAQRQSYLKNIIHLIPAFGPDRAQLHSLQQGLTGAMQAITECAANQELPKILTDLILHSQTLENTVATYLHFLMIDKEVADNFSLELLAEKNPQYYSPLHHIYEPMTGTNNTELLIASLSRFYQSSQPLQIKSAEPIKLTIKLATLAKIPFANFMTDTDKKNYIAVAALLNSLTSVRKTFENFQTLVPSIGTYLYATSYYEQVNDLTIHYIQLIRKIQTLLQGLLQTADQGLHQLFIQQNPKRLIHFEKNMRSLETRIAKGTTTTLLLDTHCKAAIHAMQQYQFEMQKLVAKVHHGTAAAEINGVMNNLFVEITDLNLILPTVLGDTVLQLTPTTAPAVTNIALAFKQSAPQEIPSVFSHLDTASLSDKLLEPVNQVCSKPSSNIATGAILLAGVTGLTLFKQLKRSSRFAAKALKDKPLPRITDFFKPKENSNADRVVVAEAKRFSQ